MKNSLYIYGVIKANAPQEFGEIGICDSSSKVLTIGFKDLAAVVSCSPFKVYDSLAKEETVKDLVTHQFVIEKVMESFTIIPVKFGTMVETENDIAKFLDKGYSLLSNALRKIEGKIELDVVTSWNLPKTLGAIYCRSRQIKRKQKEIALKGNKAAVEDKVALGKLVDKALKGRKTKLGKLILQALKKEALDVCLHDLATDEIMLNAAFLVKKENEEFFNKAVNRLNQKLKNTLDFRVVGPLPPYSFATVVIESLDKGEVEAAQQLLKLRGELSREKVKDAYNQLVKRFHPDKGGDPLMFEFVTKAYKLLRKYAEHDLIGVYLHKWTEDMSKGSPVYKTPRRWRE